MVVFKVPKKYYSATRDKRVINFMTRYFRYQQQTLPSQPLGNWAFWTEYRACKNLQIVYWLYKLTGDTFLLDSGAVQQFHGQSQGMYGGDEAIHGNNPT